MVTGRLPSGRAGGLVGAEPKHEVDAVPVGRQTAERALNLLGGWVGKGTIAASDVLPCPCPGELVSP